MAAKNIPIAGKTAERVKLIKYKYSARGCSLLRYSYGDTAHKYCIFY